jgi:hypothetical protein
MGSGVSSRGSWTNRKTGFVPRRSGRANLAADVAIVVMLSEDGLRWIEVQRWRRLGFFSRGGALIYWDFQPCQPPCDIAKLTYITRKYIYNLQWENCDINLNV